MKHDKDKHNQPPKTKKNRFHAISKEIINLEHQTTPQTFLQVIKRKPFSIFMMLISSMMFSFGITIILSQSKTIPSGLTAIPTLITYIVPQTQPYFALLYLAFNLPLLIIFWKHLKKSFILLTVIWMLFQNLWQLVFNITEIHKFLVYHVSITPQNWNVENALKDNSIVFPFIYYTVIGAILIGVSIGLAWKFGGSTGGTDIISYYYSTKKKKSIGKFMFIISLIIAFSSLLIFGILGHFDIGGKIYRVLGIQVVSTMIYIFLTSIVVNWIFPKYKKVSISFYTAEPEKIVAHLKNMRYWHSYNIWEGTSGYTGKSTYKVKTVCLYLEAKPLIEQLKQIDPTIWVSIKPVLETSGLFDTSKIE
ncbi:YitT family protein [Mycoplasma procyoni]|uniref:YitT family protein n=1 Tax=Mycoplasma procyoni TaxID=568784 RepID=UPI00197C32DB|nr:YitT family protein [Mycoplasma procyoni]MBN3534561.1 YitT family protein [Mycoplasma procyoni]